MKTKIETTLIASAPHRETLLKQVQSYFYNHTIFFQGEEVHNSTGAMKNFRVKKGAGRWRFERIHQNEAAKA